MTLQIPEAVTTAPDFLEGGGEMGAAMRAFDWASTPLGPPQAWPRTLKTCLRIMLASFTKSADSLALEIEHRRRIERHQNLLLDELNHRVKNTLATVQAMAMQTLKGVDLPARDAFLARLFALSSQHDLLTLDNWEGTSFEGVVRRALRPWREEGRTRFTVEGPAVHLEPKQALALGMAFHELATNAAKYGAFSNDTGTVQVRWTVEPGLLKLCWEEHGGPAICRPQRRGFGLRLIEHGLAREISGKVSLDFRPEGLVCAWDMKLS
jgi:two-component sensor histidine kinase